MLRPALQIAAAVALSVVAAIAAVAMTAGRGPVGPAADPGRGARAVALATLALTAEQARLSVEAHAITENGYLRAGAEELDGYAVGGALRTYCEAVGLTACAAYDADGAAFSDDDAPLAAAELREARALKPGELDVRLSGASGRLAVTGLVPLTGDGGLFGFVRLERRLGDAALGPLADAAGFGLGLTVGERLVASSASEAKHWTGRAALALTAGDGPVGVVFATPDAGSEAKDPVRAVAGWLCGIGGALLLAVLLILRRTLLPARAVAAALAGVAERPDEAPLPVASGTGALRELAAKAAAAVSAQREQVRTARTAVEDVERKLTRLGDLLSIEDGAFRLFVEAARELHELCATEAGALRRNSDADHRERLAQILRHVDALLANARLFNLVRVQHAARDCEDFLVKVLAGGRLDVSVADMLSMHLASIDREVAAYVDLRARVLGDGSEGERLGQQMALRSRWLTSLIGRLFNVLKNPEDHVEALGRLFSEYQSAVAAVGNEDLAEYVVRYERTAREQAARSGKELAQVVLTGNCRYLPHWAMRRLNDVFVHCLRNAVEHGLETPLPRRAAGKPEAGRIVIEANLIDQMCQVVIRDDGRGIAADELRTKAVGKGFLTPGEAAALSDEAALELAFRTGFSTAGVVTDLSGRGIGLDFVREMLRRLGGDAQLRSGVGLGTEVHLHFPLQESRFEARSSLFNVRAKLEGVLRALAPVLGRTEARVVSAAGATRSELVVSDGLLFTAAMKELVLGINTYAPKPCRLTLAVEPAAYGATRGGLESLTLRLVITHGDGRPCPEALAPLDLSPSGRLGGLLLDCGLMVADGGASHELALLMPSGATELPGHASLAVLALVDDHAGVAGLVAAQARQSYGSLATQVWGRDGVAEFLAAARTGVAIVIADDEAVADQTLMRRLAGHDLDLVVVSAVPTALPLRTIYSINGDPLILEGWLDAAAVGQALEFSVQKLWKAWRARQPLAPGLTLAA